MVDIFPDLPAGVDTPNAVERLPFDAISVLPVEAAMKASATTIVRFSVLSGLLLTVATVWLAFTLPALNVSLSVIDDRVVVEGLADVSQPAVVTALRSSAGEHSLTAFDLLDEPDVVDTWGELNDFFARQSRLTEVVGGNKLELGLVDGSWRAVEVSSRHPSTLHWTFYAQTIAALLVWLAGLVTYAFSDRRAGARAYAISAVGIAVAIWPAAIYTTRALVLDGALFRALSAIDHAGAFLFAVGVLALFASYPTRLIRRLWWLWASAPVGYAVDQLQLMPKASGDFYRAMTVYFAFFMLLAPWQWLASRKDPVARAVFRWIFLAVFLGMTSFNFAIMLPVVVGMPKFASQGFALTCYGGTYAGISLGVLKLRLFELDRWWFRAWSWLLGGSLVILGDILLMSLFELGSRESLLLTVALVGWLYFPLRQWVWGRLVRLQPSVDALDITSIVGARSATELDEKLAAAARSLFAPLRIEARRERLDAPRLDALGTTLLLPKPSGGHFVCHYRNEGKDLFRPRDLKEAKRLLVVVDSVARALRAHDEGQQQERQRIRRDLHDDMGASIIRIIHATRDEGVAALARRTMRDLRNVLLALSPEAASIGETLDDLRSEVAAQVETQGRLTWHIEGSADWQLSSRQRANLVRTVREATTNALRHGGGAVEYRFRLSDDAIQVEIENPTPDSRREEGTGLGMSNIAARIEELGGRVELTKRERTFCLALHLPRRASA